MPALGRGQASLTIATSGGQPEKRGEGRLGGQHPGSTVCPPPLLLTLSCYQVDPTRALVWTRPGPVNS